MIITGATEYYPEPTYTADHLMTWPWRIWYYLLVPARNSNLETTNYWPRKKRSPIKGVLRAQPKDVITILLNTIAHNEQAMHSFYFFSNSTATKYIE